MCNKKVYKVNKSECIFLACNVSGGNVSGVLKVVCLSQVTFWIYIYKSLFNTYFCSYTSMLNQFVHDSKCGFIVTCYIYGNVSGQF